MVETPAGIVIVPANESDVPRWAALRCQLWPEASEEEHASELHALFSSGRRYAGLLALDGDATVGFAEIALRTDYVNGCDSSPVAFLEGIWVTPARRAQGIGRRLFAAVMSWAVAAGCKELASDALLTDTQSQAFHRAVGFEETERVVYFRKELQ